MPATETDLPERIVRLTDEDLTKLLESESLRCLISGSQAGEVDVLARAEAYRRWGSIFPPKRAVVLPPVDELSKREIPSSPVADKTTRKIAALAILSWDFLGWLSSAIWLLIKVAMPAQDSAEMIGSIIGTIVGLLVGAAWEIIPCLYLIRGKNWARIFLLVNRWLYLVASVIITSALAFYFRSYALCALVCLGAGVMGCQIVLLRKRISRHAAKGWLWPFAILTAVAYLVGISQADDILGEFRLVQSGQTVSEYKSALHYKAGIPAGWRVLDKAEAAKIMPRDISAADLVVAKSDQSAYGIFVAENLDGRVYSQEELQKVSDWLRQTYLTGMGKIEPYAVEGGTGLSGQQSVMGREFAYITFFKPLKSVGITGFFWTLSNKAVSLAKDVAMFQRGLQELPRREWQDRKTAKDIFEANSDAVVLIELLNNKKKPVGSASGFNLEPDGLIVTNLHVLADSAAYVHAHFPRNGKFEDVRVVGVGDNATDLAFLKIEGANLPVVRPTVMDDVAVGDKIFVVGSPRGLVNTLSEGIVSGTRKFVDGGYAYQITAPVSPGSSGSAVFNEFGEVVGICAGTLSEGQNLNYFIPADEIKKVQVFDRPVPLKDLKNYLNLRRAKSAVK